MKRRDFIKNTALTAGGLLATGCINSHDYWDLLVDVNTPAQIAGLALWLKGDAGITQSGGFVSQWDDQSGKGNHATQPGATTVQPLWVDNTLNGRPVLSFDGNDELSIIPFFNLGNVTSFVVAQTTNTGAIRSFFRASTPPNGPRWYHRQNSAFQFVAGPSPAVTISTALNTNYNIQTFYHNIPTLSAWLNGQLLGNGTLNQTGGFTLVYIGSNSSAQYLIGNIAEVILYTKSLSTAERQLVENYLSVKYNISLTI